MKKSLVAGVSFGSGRSKTAPLRDGVNVGAQSCCARFGILLAATFLASALPTRAADAPWVHAQFAPGDFKLAEGAQLAQVFVAPEDFKVVQIAGNLFTGDVELVTGHKPALVTDAAKLNSSAVLIGTLGKCPLIDKLVADGKLDAKQLVGQWESFIITTVAKPLPGVDSALVIVGSDRRGTAYGVFEVSQGIGVSPWYWWADVTPGHKDNVYVAAGLRRFGPPSVQYRGIFINDEDWGLNPWASKTFEPEANGPGPKTALLVHPPASPAEAAAEAKINSIGPKTYGRIFELLLRLKANTLWPAMHDVSTAFNLVPGNAQMADDYGIVMGASHCEPMLRNNVGEWPHDDQAAFNFVTNPVGVTAYWEERMRTNGKYENLYTIGMRGIHDGPMQGATGQAAVPVLEKIFGVQRDLISKYVNPNPAKVPQIFCPYKEVLDLFLRDLQVPPDVTVVFPDDNFGYIRYLPTPEQIAVRPGGFGIYYHISYLGGPFSYVWLNTTPPALIWEEMSKAYDHGIQKFWMLNVGDLKPGEIGIDFFMQMAWDIKKWNLSNLPDYLKSFAAQQFGATAAPVVAKLLTDYYRLDYQRKPEHLQWYISNSTLKEQPRASDFSYVDYNHEGQTRFLDAEKMAQSATSIAASLPAAKQDGFYELVGYPATGAALANELFFSNELGVFDLARGNAGAANWAAKFKVAAVQLDAATTRYNQSLANGKWSGMMPDDVQQKDRSYRDGALSLSPGLGAYQPAAAPGVGVAISGRTEPLQNGETAALPLVDPYVAKDVSVEVFATGSATTEWTAKPDADWIGLTRLNQAGNSSALPGDGHDVQLEVGVDWTKAPKGADVSGNIIITDGKNTFTVKVPVYNPAEVRPEQLKGMFVQSDGVVSMEAEHFTKKTDQLGAAWQIIPGLGRTGDAVGIFPTTTPSVDLAKVATAAPALEYQFYMFSKGDVTIHYNLIPTQPIVYGQGLRYAVALDNGPPQLVTITKGTGREVTNRAWAENVLDNTTTATTQHTLAAPGPHTLKIYMIDPGVLLEKIVVDAGGLRPSYLGPPETRVSAK